MPKVKIKYGKGYITRVLNSIPQSQLLTMKECVKIGYTPSKLIKEFRISQTWAEIVYNQYRLPDYSPLAIIGHKDEPYYKEEIFVLPKYTLEELDGEEKAIAKKDTSTKLWTWEE